MIFSKHTSKKQSPIHKYQGAFWKNKKVALLGGSFNPAHEGHYHLALKAIEKLDCDFVWWMVSPGNPLKNKNNMADFDRRFDSVLKIVGHHPKMIVTDIERQLGTVYTYFTLKKLKKHFPHTEFVWIMGEDNLFNIHRWYRWKDIFNMMHVALFHRKESSVSKRVSLNFQALNQLQNRRINRRNGHHIYQHTPKRWVLFRSKRFDKSSTEVRKQTNWL